MERSDRCPQRVIQCLLLNPHRLDHSFNKPLTSLLIIETRRMTEVLCIVSPVMMPATVDYIVPPSVNV